MELYDVEFDDDLDIDTVGGLLALELGRVPLPGAQVQTHGLRLRAEGGNDHRGRVRVGTVLVSAVDEAPQAWAGVTAETATRATIAAGSGSQCSLGMEEGHE